MSSAERITMNDRPKIANPVSAGHPTDEMAPAKLCSDEVLIVDDQESSQLVLQHLVLSTGRRTEVVSNGTEALDYLKEKVPVLVLLDLEMPSLDGRAFLETLHRDDPSVVYVPIAVVTAKPVSEHLDLLRYGAVIDILPKPLRRRDLQRLLVAADALSHSSICKTEAIAG